MLAASLLPLLLRTTPLLARRQPLSKPQAVICPPSAIWHRDVACMRRHSRGRGRNDLAPLCAGWLITVTLAC